MKRLFNHLKSGNTNNKGLINDFYWFKIFFSSDVSHYGAKHIPTKLMLVCQSMGLEFGCSLDSFLPSVRNYNGSADCWACNVTCSLGKVLIFSILLPMYLTRICVNNNEKEHNSYCYENVLFIDRYFEHEQKLHFCWVVILLKCYESFRKTDFHRTKSHVE